jgi:hypothetical protein
LSPMASDSLRSTRSATPTPFELSASPANLWANPNTFVVLMAT